MAKRLGTMATTTVTGSESMPMKDEFTKHADYVNAVDFNGANWTAKSRPEWYIPAILAGMVGMELNRLELRPIPNNALSIPANPKIQNVLAGTEWH